MIVLAALGKLSDGTWSATRISVHNKLQYMRQLRTVLHDLFERMHIPARPTENPSPHG